ncbi:MAG: hypothetical protein IRY85_20485 [Micromonosporaceae bacterium]|nr:hypothetical protein [Micromonosporaceae bacterium]
MALSLKTGRTISVLAAGVVGTALAVAIAASAAHASPWEFAGAYATDAQEAGQSGVAAGEWHDFQCVLFEGLHDLYVRTR